MQNVLRRRRLRRTGAFVFHAKIPKRPVKRSTAGGRDAMVPEHGFVAAPRLAARQIRAEPPHRARPAEPAAGFEPEAGLGLAPADLGSREEGSAAHPSHRPRPCRTEPQPGAIGLGCRKVGRCLRRRAHPQRVRTSRQPARRFRGVDSIARHAHRHPRVEPGLDPSRSFRVSANALSARMSRVAGTRDDHPMSSPRYRSCHKGGVIELRADRRAPKWVGLPHRRPR